MLHDTHIREEEEELMLWYFCSHNCNDRRLSDSRILTTYSAVSTHYTNVTDAETDRMAIAYNMLVCNASRHDK